MSRVIVSAIYTVSQKGTSMLLPITSANIDRFSKLFSLLNSAINLQQNVYYIAHHTLTVLLHYLAKSKLLILLICKHNKCKCGYLAWKRGCFYPPHICGPWHQNKWRVYLGRAVETWDAARYPCNFWRLLHFFQQDSAPTGRLGSWDGHATAASGSVFHCCQSATFQQPRPQPCVGYDAGPHLLGEGARRWRSEAVFDWRVGQSGAKRHRWHDRPVAFTTSYRVHAKGGHFEQSCNLHLNFVIKWHLIVTSEVECIILI